MSRLDELIAELCQDGVEYQPLQEVADIRRGVRVVRNQLSTQGQYPVYQNSLTPLGYHTEMNCEAETTFVICAGAAGDVGYSKVDFWAADDCHYCKSTEKLLSRFLYHVLLWKQTFLYSQVRKGSVPRLSRTVLERIRIPVPPLPIQQEIVRILDSFTDYTAKLTAKITAELEARKKQYSYYSKLMFDFLKETNETMPLSTFGKWSGGKTPSMAEKRFWENGTVPWISSKDMKESILRDTEDHIAECALKDASMTLYPNNCIAIVTRSGILKHTFPIVFVPFQTTVNQDIKILTPKDEVIPKYIFLAMKAYAEDIRTRAKKQGGTVDSLEFQKVLDFEIPLPSLHEQQRIVSILERFDTFCNDITSGLPAEIAARQKQYEYYRDKLLTFKHKEEVST